MARRESLGKGLGALIPKNDKPAAAEQNDKPREFFRCPIDRIRRNPDQPRKSFEKESLAGLAQTIRENGILEPIIVRAEGDGYMIVAGERRWRAAQQAGLHEVPVRLLENLGEHGEKALELALIENLHREDLNPIEEAQALAALVESHGYTQEQASKVAGMSRAALANALRLLHLDKGIQAQVQAGTISAGHARALLAIDDSWARKQLAKKIVEKGISVRQAEAEARKAGQPAKPGKGKAGGGGKFESAHVEQLAQNLTRQLGTKVEIKASRPDRGKIEVTYNNLDEFDRLVEALKRFKS